MLLDTPNEDTYFGSSLLLWMVLERNLGMECDESAVYVVPDNATVDVLLWIHICFRLVLEHWILQQVQCFGDH